MSFRIPHTGLNPCTDPPLGERLLTQPDLGQPSELDPELADHLITCPSCLGVVERARRARSVWADDAPSDAETASAFSRFARFDAGTRETASVGARSILTFAGAGAALAALVLLLLGRATNGTALNHATSAPAPSIANLVAGAPAATAAPSAPADEGAYLVGPRGRIPLADGARIRLARGEHARVVLGAGWAPIEVDGPGLVEAWSAPSETCGWRLEVASPPTVDQAEPAKGASAPNQVPTTRILVPIRAAEPQRALDANVPAEQQVVAGPLGEVAAGEPIRAANLAGAPAGDARETAGANHRNDGAGAPRSAPDSTAPRSGHSATREHTARGPTALGLAGDTTAPSGAWTRAARALDRGDFEAADRALAELCRDTDARTRDAARLTRAKLWVGHGRTAAARPVLEDLAAHGATPLVRRDAQELLDEDRAP